MNNEIHLFDPVHACLSEWICVNDGVMGGLSTSRVEVNPEHYLHWAGTVSMENNGGFASVKHKLPTHNLSACRGISLLTKGDGKLYKLNLANDPDSGSPRFQARFTAHSSMQLIFIPFGELTASFRGKRVDATFDPSYLRQIGFLIADRQEGDFDLNIIRISAYA